MKLTPMWITPILALAVAACPGNDPGLSEGEAKTAQLSVQLASGNAKQAGSTVSYEVRVDGGPAAINAFGIDVTFDPALLSYRSAAAGDLTAGFTQFGANPTGNGTIRIGGFSVDEPVPAGATGALAILEFETVGQAPDTLAIQKSMDDVEIFSTVAQ